jgi:hypothetical protein
LFAFLAEHRGALFPVEMFADMYRRRTDDRAQRVLPSGLFQDAGRGVQDLLP